MDEFRKLTKLQREGVKELRDQLKGQKKKVNDSGNNTRVSAVELTTVNSRVQALEQAIVAGVANASTASTDTAQDDASALTPSLQPPSGAASQGSVSGYLWNRRNNQGNHPGRN